MVDHTEDHATRHGFGGPDELDIRTLIRGGLPPDGTKFFFEDGTLQTVSTGGMELDVQVFDTPGASTWTKPDGASMVHILVVSGGAGGGGGRRGAAGTGRMCGAGGGGGALSEGWFRADDLPATMDVVVGAGGSGGSAATSDSTNGGGGNDGEDSYVGSTTDWLGLTNSTVIGAVGGELGQGGIQATSAQPGPRGGYGTYDGGEGGQTDDQQGTEGGWSSRGGAGGGSGGGIDPSNNNFIGSNGGITKAFAYSPSSNFGALETNGDDGFNEFGSTGPTTDGNVPSVGANGGGGGGAGNTAGSIAGGTGGDGGWPGGGGGGGGASTNGANSGAGGTGGDGLVVITSWIPADGGGDSLWTYLAGDLYPTTQPTNDFIVAPEDKIHLSAGGGNFDNEVLIETTHAFGVITITASADGHGLFVGNGVVDMFGPNGSIVDLNDSTGAGDLNIGLQRDFNTQTFGDFNLQTGVGGPAGDINMGAGRDINQSAANWWSCSGDVTTSMGKRPDQNSPTQISGDPIVFVLESAAPVDATLATYTDYGTPRYAGFVAWVDESGNNLKFRVVYADGTTFKTGTVALT